MAKTLIREWRGETAGSCHRYFLSPGERPGSWPEQPDLRVEVAVVGAGLSGLTAAYHLRDREVVVLEAGAAPGGVCLTEEYEGIPYPAGSAYSYYPWTEAWAAWYRDLGLDVEAAVVEPPASALYYRGQWFPDCYSAAGVRQLPFPPAVREGLLRLAEDLAAWEEEWDPLGEEEFSRPELDRLSLADYLERERGLPPVATAFFAPYCASCLGALPHQVSAWAGLSFLMSEFSTSARLMAFPEGNARLVTALVAALPRAPRLGQVVVGLRFSRDRIRLLARGARGEALCVEAQVAILAGGKFAMQHLLPPEAGWPAEDFRHFRYSSYVVAALLGPLEIQAPGYENWMMEEEAFSDFILSPRRAEARTRKAMVLYAPQPFPTGRRELLDQPAEVQAERLLQAVARRFPAAAAAVEEVRLYRFGHAQVVPYPGFLTLLKKEGRPRPVKGRLILAHSDLAGLPCVEAAILEGQKAARRAREVLSTREGM
ncbi:MAG: FAD-dependent oxidoreductase [Desulfobaccales bacterium]